MSSDHLDQIIAGLDEDERRVLSRRLLREGYGPSTVLDALEAAVTCELERALVYFFTWCNLTRWEIDGPADGCGTWLFVNLEAARGRDEFLRPIIEEAGRLRPMRNDGTSQTHWETLHGPLPRARQWRESWKVDRTEIEGWLTREADKQKEKVNETIQASA